MSDAAKFYIVPAVLYALVASPMTYQKTRDVFGSWVATSEGTAKFGGLILHAIVFILLATLAMRYFPGRRSGFSHSTAGEGSNQMGMNTKLQDVDRILAPAPYEDLRD
jgi:hypothetical protein